MRHMLATWLLYSTLVSTQAFGPAGGMFPWQQWIPGTGYGDEFFVAANATNDATCAVEFLANVTVYKGDPNCNRTVYQDVDVSKNK